MDFALLPPEINSARMYSGPGPGPLLAAAASWDALAAELHTTGTAYQSVIAELDSGWSGPSATAMAAAAAPYASWMHTTSVQAEQTAAQAKAAVAAYEAAFAMTVPPPVIAANRSLLMALIATNFLGQNTPAIAATEAHYAEMWAQDATAMYTYAGSSAAASQLTPFTTPPQTASPAGAANQAGSVARSAAAAAGAHSESVVTALTQGLQSLTAPAASTSSSGASSQLAALLPSIAADPGLALSFAGILADAIGTFGVDLAGPFGFGLAGIDVIGEGLAPLIELAPLDGLAGAALVSANVGQSAVISGLSVPQSWATVAPTLIQQVASASSTAGATASALAAGETAVPFVEMAGAGLAGRATASIGQSAGGRPATTIRRRPAPPPLEPERPRQPLYSLLLGVDVELRELAELRSAGILTDEEYSTQKRQLLGR